MNKQEKKATCLLLIVNDRREVDKSRVNVISPGARKNYLVKSNFINTKLNVSEKFFKWGYEMLYNES